MKQFSNLKRAFLPCLFVLLTLPAWGQMQPVTKNFRKTPLKNVLKEVEAQTGLSIMYDTRELNLERPVTASFDRTPVSQVLREVLGEILDYTYKAFAATDYDAARRIEPVEEVVDDLVATLRTNHIRRVRDGQCTVYAGLTFLDILVNVERIADQCSNIGVFTLSMTDERIMNNHHDYIHALHQGKDPLFNRAYQEAHDKYFGELERIKHGK